MARIDTIAKIRTYNVRRSHDGRRLIIIEQLAQNGRLLGVVVADPHDYDEG